MKVLLVNGSPHSEGNTYESLKKASKGLIEKGIEVEHFHIGNKPVHGCIDCKKCAITHRCIFKEDVCNVLIEKMVEADGIIIGSPVYFAGPNGSLCALLDRVFYAAGEHGQLFIGKPAAALVSCYRAGATSALDRLNKYFSYSQMPIVSSLYWNMVFEQSAFISEDRFGDEILEKLGENMATLLRSRFAG